MASLLILINLSGVLGPELSQSNAIGQYTAPAKPTGVWPQFCHLISLAGGI